MNFSQNTPYYFFDLSKIKENWTVMRETLLVDKLYYALKANSDIEIIKLLNSLNANFEIASLGELKLLKSINVKTQKIISSTPIKSRIFIKELMLNHIEYVVFDSILEFKKIKELHPYAKKIMRININKYSQISPAFGLTIDDFLCDFVDQADRSNIDGITFYIAKNKSINTINNIFNDIEYIIHYLPNCNIINIGGNYRLPYEINRCFYEQLNKRITKIKHEYGCLIYAEIGRSIVKSSGQLITTIISKRKINDETWIYIDAGEPSGISYAPKKISQYPKKTSVKEIKYKFFDITCSHKLLFEFKSYNEFEINDILIFENYGSYTIAKCSSFHGWCRPSVYYNFFNI